MEGSTVASITLKYYFSVMRITSKGQVTIPQEMRERYGLHPQTEVEFASGEGGVVIRPARTRRCDFGNGSVGREAAPRRSLQPTR